MSSSDQLPSASPPTVSVVILAFNRRDALRVTLERTRALDYPQRLVDVVVVDNASDDGTAAMVRAEFPDVRLIRRETNTGVSAWNDGFRVAAGDFVLILDDDCYLPGDGLARAVAGALEQDADLVSFGVTSSEEEGYRFDVEEYTTGLLCFWGCATLVRRTALDALVGFDPEIFLYAHELEFMLRFFDRGFRHLYLPEVVAVHMKAPNNYRGGPIPERAYRLNHRNWGYIAAKHLRSRDAAAALLALMLRSAREGMRDDRMAYKAVGDSLRGFVAGLRYRDAVRGPVSRTYRRNFETFASPWWTSRTPLEMARDLLTPGPTPKGDRGHRSEWIAARKRYYPDRSGVLEL